MAIVLAVLCNPVHSGHVWAASVHFLLICMEAGTAHQVASPCQRESSCERLKKQQDREASCSWTETDVLSDKNACLSAGASQTSVAACAMTAKLSCTLRVMLWYIFTVKSYAAAAPLAIAVCDSYRLLRPCAHGML